MKPSWNMLEWLVFGVSFALVAAVFGSVALEAYTEGDAPPDLVVTLGAPLRGSGGWRVPVMVENRGDHTAEEVQVGVDLREKDQVQEHTEFSLPYVPRHSRREGWVTFRQEPAAARLEGRALGYARP